MSPQLAQDRLPYLQNIRQHALVQVAVDELSLEEKTIVKLRYGILQDDELTLRDIGEILGLSRERVRQIESRAEAKCRRSVRRER
jgi:RNA polymerase primary sigma factor